jgi:hypothetical protein
VYSLPKNRRLLKFTHSSEQGRWKSPAFERKAMTGADSCIFQSTQKYNARAKKKLNNDFRVIIVHWLDEYCIQLLTVMGLLFLLTPEDHKSCYDSLITLIVMCFAISSLAHKCPNETTGTPKSHLSKAERGIGPQLKFFGYHGRPCLSSPAHEHHTP